MRDSDVTAPQFRFGSTARYSPSLRTGGAPSQRLFPARGRSGNCLSEHWPTIDALAISELPKRLGPQGGGDHPRGPEECRHWQRRTF
jgi:hypothetical protein